MAFSTYDELQAAAAAWLNRADLSARIPEFVTLAEARLSRLLRTRRAEKDAALTAVVGSRTISLPTAYTEALACWITPTGSTERCEIRFVDPALITVFADQGQPMAWTIDGGDLAFERPCDQTYPVTLRYLEGFALSAEATTNALLSQYPDVYLAAVMCEGAPFLFDTDLLALWEGKLTRAISEINAKEARSRSQSRLVSEYARIQRAVRSGGYDIRNDR